MSHINTHIGQDDVPIRCEYEILNDDKLGLELRVTGLYVFFKDSVGQSVKYDLSPSLTETVCNSFLADCLAHELNERKRLADGDGEGSGYATRHTLSHYMQHLAAIGGV